MQFLNKYSEMFYAGLRIVAGFMFTLHGVQKLLPMFGGPAGDAIPAFVKYGAGGIELIGGPLILIGLLTRPAAFICSGTMAAAYFMHAFGFGQGFSTLIPLSEPAGNGGELAALYCWVFLFIAAKGAGLFSVDSGLKRG